MTTWTKEELLSIYNKIKDDIKTEYTAWEYFYYVDHPEEFNLATAVSFEILNRNMTMKTDMLDKYTSPERIGLFANTELVEKACVGVKIELFDFLKFPIKLEFGDDTHLKISPGDGKYASDLHFKSSGSSNIQYNIEVKTVKAIDEGLKYYSGHQTKTGFPYNADFMIFFLLEKQEFYLIGRDIEYFHYNTKQYAKINNSFERRSIDRPRLDMQYRTVLDEHQNPIIDKQTFVIKKLNLSTSRVIQDVKKINTWNKELLLLASKIVDTLGIEQKFSDRKNC